MPALFSQEETIACPFVFGFLGSCGSLLPSLPGPGFCFSGLLGSGFFSPGFGLPPAFLRSFSKAYLASVVGEKLSLLPRYSGSLDMPIGQKHVCTFVSLRLGQWELRTIAFFAREISCDLGANGGVSILPFLFPTALLLVSFLHSDIFTWGGYAALHQK